ncbi:MAG: 2-C-methyl-D-erythritol 2,4-cyclodiphosphate synthase [Clostridia bacterium]|nr:2-C-methyl-D-erythritol 2,4-cyclodiphosphate synthase [Clostridia bacterium]
MKVTLILACAGKGTRAGFDKNKLLVTINGTTVLKETYLAFKNSGLIDEYIISASECDVAEIKTIVDSDVKIVLGGLTRTDSVKNALSLVTGDIVLIHDGARPFVTAKIIKDCIDGAVKFGGAIPVLPSPNTAVKVKSGIVSKYLGKDDVFSVHTPQGFKTELIKRAYAHASKKSFNDDGEVYKEFIGDLHVFNSDAQNVKLTYPEDFNRIDSDCRFGTGFDCHKLVENRKLILGGVVIPHDKGLLGHSDADVLTHAIMDAILSALAMRDIGYHFSDKDPKYKDADSMKLLETVLSMIKEKGYKVSSVSATIMAEKPKLLKYVPTITENLSNALNLHASRVGIGATTLEGLGFVGREEGICVHATAVLINE